MFTPVTAQVRPSTEPTWELLSGTGEAGWYHPAALPQPTDPKPLPGRDTQGSHNSPGAPSLHKWKHRVPALSPSRAVASLGLSLGRKSCDTQSSGTVTAETKSWSGCWPWDWPCSPLPTTWLTPYTPRAPLSSPPAPRACCGPNTSPREEPHPGL